VELFETRRQWFGSSSGVVISEQGDDRNKQLVALYRIDEVAVGPADEPRRAVIRAGSR
jgi:hypothetical protein